MWQEMRSQDGALTERDHLPQISFLEEACACVRVCVFLPLKPFFSSTFLQMHLLAAAPRCLTFAYPSNLYLNLRRLRFPPANVHMQARARETVSGFLFLSLYLVTSINFSALALCESSLPEHC